MKIIKPNGYWTKERCIEDAKKYNTRTEWEKNSRSAYIAASKNKWLNECCEHMESGKIKWTKEMCHEYALKCETKKEFIEKYPKAYSAAYYNKWLDKICGHMYHLGSKFKRLIYVYIFPDRSVYVGLTYNERKRMDDHMKYRGTVKNYIKKTGFKPKYKKLTNYIPREDAVILEQEYVERYKKGGYKILNKIKAGGLGGGERTWTKEMCHEYALKCNTRSELIKKYSNVYSAALKYKWLVDICSHMEYVYVKPTKRECIKDAKKYKTKTEWRKKSSTIYRFAYRSKWLDECCGHMLSGKIRWTKEKCIKDAKKYNTRTEWDKNSSGAYIAACRNKWLGECCKHMESGIKWRKKHCIEDAKKYKTRGEWRKNSGSAYSSARKNKWLDECFPPKN